MSVAELKIFIHEKIDSLSSPEQLNIVLDVIKKVENQLDSSAIDAEMIFKEASEKYGNVLKKLAE
jgi:hypothetical protein